MNSVNQQRPRMCGRLAAFALLLVVAVGCGGRANGSSKGDVDPVPECESYASALGDCNARLGIDHATIDSQLASMKSAFDARSVDPAARAELRQSCIAALDHLRGFCRPQQPSPTSKTE